MTTATINWVLPTSRSKGEPLPADEIASVDVFDSGNADPATPIGSVAGAGTSFTTEVLSVGSHSFTMVVRDTTGHSSAASAPASIDVPATLSNPNPVTDVTVTLNT